MIKQLKTKLIKPGKDFWYWMLAATLVVFIISFCAGCGATANVNENQKSLGGGFALGAASKSLLDKFQDFMVSDKRTTKPFLEVCEARVDDDGEWDFEPIQKYMDPNEDPKSPEFMHFLAAAFNIEVTCIISPCNKGEACRRTEPWGDFMARNNNRFTSVEVNGANVENILNQCKMVPEFCMDVLAHYEGQSLIIERK